MLDRKNGNIVFIFKNKNDCKNIKIHIDRTFLCRLLKARNLTEKSLIEKKYKLCAN